MGTGHAEVVQRNDALVDARTLPEGSAGDVVQRYLTKHVARLRRDEHRLHDGHDEGVHRMRVAARRLRSALGSYRPLLDRSATDRLRAELKWLGRALAEARDAKVMQDRLVGLLGPLSPSITAHLEARLRAGHTAAATALRSARYRRLLDDLDAFSRTPPLTEAARAPARQALPELLGADVDRVRKRHRGFPAAADPAERDRTLHEIRKAAKQLRYAAESSEPVFGKRARRLKARATALTLVLGEHQDTVVARATLRQIGVRTVLGPEEARAFGRLQELDEARAADLERAYPPLLARLPDGDLGAWLTR